MPATGPYHHRPSDGDAAWSTGARIGEAFAGLGLLVGPRTSPVSQLGAWMSSSQLSIQLYTVREALAEDLDGTLGRLADMGYRQVELFGFVDRVPQLEAALQAHDLRAPSGHASVVGPGHDPKAAFDAAVTLGLTTIIDPMVDPKRWTSRESVEALAKEFNETVGPAEQAGLRFGYHNHWWETENRIDGTPALEVFADQLDDRVVLEVDTYWAEVGGVSAAELLGRLGQRVQFIHVKDGAITRNGKDQVAVGAGSIDVAGILAAAPQALRVVELDDCAGDVFDAVRASFTYLTENGVSA